MKADLLIKQISVLENGSERKKCPGLLMAKWLPSGDTILLNQAGRKLELRDNTPIDFTSYQEQLELRAEVTGKSWIEIQIISMTNFGLLGKLMVELLKLGKDKWPLPIGASLLDNISEDIKKGAPQVIAQGKSEVLSHNNIFKSLRIDLVAPEDVLGDLSGPIDPITGMPIEGQAERSILLPKDSPNGFVLIDIADSNI
ncbi:MAG: hypothetical protein Q8O79_02695 [Pseudomonadota bacterium]|nr:hypothetical protein [Pseudomonadota bacterium]